ncbi:MAG: hypothetical protein ACYC5G_02120 [Candidatus Doudnabacteria bacterium]
MDKKVNVAIGLGCTFGYIPSQFFHSWIGMKKPQHSVIFSDRGRPDDMRNSIISQVLNSKEKFSHILFLDIDHYHHPETIIKLISHNQSIVSGLSFRRSDPYDPIMFSQCGNKFNNIIQWNDGDLLEVDTIGAASLLVDIEVFNKMKSPWFEMGYKFGEGVVSEDFAFCLKAKELGYKIWCDTSCTNDHIGILNVNKSTWEKNGARTVGGI